MRVSDRGFPIMLGLKDEEGRAGKVALFLPDPVLHSKYCLMIVRTKHLITEEGLTTWSTKQLADEIADVYVHLHFCNIEAVHTMIQLLTQGKEMWEEREHE